jgi:hypothetical protein
MAVVLQVMILAVVKIKNRIKGAVEITALVAKGEL